MQQQKEREEWEEDLRNRQRNIVFPDTVLNEGRFYRNAVSGKIPLNLVQRLGLFILGIFMSVSGAFAMAMSIAVIWRNGGIAWVLGLAGLIWLLFIGVGCSLIIHAVFPNSAAQTRKSPVPAIRRNFKMLRRRSRP